MNNKDRCNLIKMIISLSVMITRAPAQTANETASLCATSPSPTWCYYIEIFPSNTFTTTTVNITDTDRQSDVYFNIAFISQGQICNNPTISFEYEQIDVELTSEYINIYDDAGVLLRQCQGNGIADNQCNVWWTCLSNYNLNISYIDVDTPYQIQLMTSSENDALCTTYHNWVTNAKLHFSCNGTLEPTTVTTEPTYYPTSQPTTQTINPTTAPTVSISLCETSPHPVWCYNIDLYPSYSVTTTTINITDTDRSSDTYFNIVLTPKEQSCINPSISFEYEQIDIQSNDEYINIIDNQGSLIQECQGNGGDDTQCDVWWTCLSDYKLSSAQINTNVSYQIQLMSSVENNALCASQLSINAKLYFNCDGTAPSPTIVPTSWTNNPTQLPTISFSSNVSDSDDEFNFMLLIGLFVGGYALLIVSCSVMRCCKNGGGISRGTIAFIMAGFMLGLDIIDVVTDISSSAVLIQGNSTCGITVCEFPADYSGLGYALIPFIIIGCSITLCLNVWSVASLFCLPQKYQLSDEHYEESDWKGVDCDTIKEQWLSNEACWGLVKMLLADFPALVIYSFLYDTASDDGVGVSYAAKLGFIFTTVDICFVIFYSCIKGVCPNYFQACLCVMVGIFLLSIHGRLDNVWDEDIPTVMQTGSDCFDSLSDELTCVLDIISSDNSASSALDDYFMLLFETKNDTTLEKIKYFTSFRIHDIDRIRSGEEDIPHALDIREYYSTIESVDGGCKKGNAPNCWLTNSSDLKDHETVQIGICYTLRYDCLFDNIGSGNNASKVSNIQKNICMDICQWED